MAERKTRTKATEQPDEAASSEKLAKPTGDEPTQLTTDLGDAAAEGEFAYAGERSDEIDDDRDDEARPGTSAHLGSEQPYAGSPS